MAKKSTIQIIKKTRDDYNRIAKHYAATRRTAGELEKFKPLIKSGQRILDWGCGNGKLIYIFGKNKVEYYGIDQSLEMIKFAKHTFKGKSIHFFCTATKEKKFKSNFFDLAFMAASFHHLPDTESRMKLLEKIFSELKPGGTIVITTWNLDSDWAREKFKKDWERMGKTDYLIPWKNQKGKILAMRYYHYFSRAELKQLLEESGFVITDMYWSRGNERTIKRLARNLVVVAKKNRSSSV